MFYREVGQFKTSYAADQAIFPILAGSDRPRSSCCLVAFVAIPLAGNDYWLRTLLTPFLISRTRGDRAESAHRLCRPGLARHRRLHGRRRLCRLQHLDLAPSLNIIVVPCLAPEWWRGGRHPVRPAIVAYRRARPRRRHVWRRSSSCHGRSSVCRGSPTTAPTASSPVPPESASLLPACRSLHRSGATC